MAEQLELETVLYDLGDDNVATVTLNRPDKLNAFNLAMRRDFRELWAKIRADDEVHAVVIRANGRAFSAGIDVTERAANIAAGTDVGSYSPNPFNAEDPGSSLSPKLNKVWKPVICAVHGIAAGGAVYWINEADIVICSDDASFFDPHVTFGMTSALEPIGLRWRIPLGEVLRWVLMGNEERISPERALAISLVTEITSREALWPRAHEIAASIAAKPTAAIQGSVKAIWDSLDMTRAQALHLAMTYTQLGNPVAEHQVNRSAVEKRQPRIR